MRRGWSVPVVAALLLSANCGNDGTTEPARTVTPFTSSPSITTPRDTAGLTVLGVPDGRTVLLSDGTRIVIDGLAAPERCWATAAAAFTKAFLLDKPVQVERLNEEPGGEASLRLRDGTEYALFAVSQGVLRGDAPHDPAFGAAETNAKKAGLGLWGAPCRGQG